VQGPTLSLGPIIQLYFLSPLDQLRDIQTNLDHLRDIQTNLYILCEHLYEDKNDRVRVY